MTVRLGVNPIGWSNDDLRSLGGDISLETCLQEARAAGYAGIELGHKFPQDPAALNAVLQAHDLTLASGWHSTGVLADDMADEALRLDRHADLLAAAGADVVILAETTGAVHGDRASPLACRPRLDRHDMGRLAERLTVLAQRMADRGMQTAYHHHMGTVVESAEEIDALLDAAGPELGLLLDAGHATFAGADPTALAKDYGERITHVHCKDIRGERLASARAGSFLDGVIDGVFTVPGDGMVDFPSMLKILAYVGYSGWLVVEAEQDPKKADPATYAALGHRNLSRMATEAGLL